MKLPTRQIGGVQEKVSVDPGVYTQLGQAVGGAFEVGSKLAGEMVQIAATRKNEAAILAMTAHYSKTKEQHGQQRSFTGDEIKALKLDLPKELTHESVLQEDGTSKQMWRPEIQAEDVYPALMLRQGRKQIEIQAETIPGGGRRAQFEQRQEAALLGLYDAEVVKAHDTRERKYITDYENQIRDLEVDGDYVVARQRIMDHPVLTPEEKEAEIRRLYQAEESRYLFGLKNHADDATIEREIERLKATGYGDIENDGEFHNSLEQSQRAAEIASMNATLAARKRDRATADADQKGAWWNNFLKGVDDPSVSAADLMLEIDRVASTGLLTPTQIIKARELAKGGAHQTAAQNKRYAELRTQATSDDVKSRDAFMDKLLGEEAANLSTDQLTALDKLQQDMKTDRSGYRSQEDMRKIALGMAGLHKTLQDMDEDDYRLIDQFDRAVDASIAALEKKEGREATPNEIQEFIDDAYATILMTERKTGGWGWFNWGEKTLIERKVEQSFIDKVYRRAVERGEPMPTPEEIYKASPQGRDQ